MQVRYLLTVSAIFILIKVTNAQSTVVDLESQLVDLKKKELQILETIDSLKLWEIHRQMFDVGYPTSSENIEVVEHSGMVLGFHCESKLAAWSFHVLSPEVADGNVSRTNDFREDEKVNCGSACESDYFLKSKNDEGKFVYDGFGYDRGHLAPSADFKWSFTALSESYFYSNMTPQHPDFNRGAWARLEGLVRKSAVDQNRSLYIVTGPVITDTMVVQERSLNQIRIPDFHYKVIADLSDDHPRAIAFLMPNEKCNKDLFDYVVTVDSIENMTGLDFFPGIEICLQDKIEGKSDYSQWGFESNSVDVEPLHPLDLPRGLFNTQQAALKVGQKVSIVGKVVSTKYIPKSESTFLNLDKAFPNQIFTIRIWKDGRQNFSYRPEVLLEGEYIVVTGRVTLDNRGVPGITVEREEQLRVFTD